MRISYKQMSDMLTDKELQEILHKVNEASSTPKRPKGTGEGTFRVISLKTLGFTEPKKNTMIIATAQHELSENIIKIVAYRNNAACWDQLRVAKPGEILTFRGFILSENLLQVMQQTTVQLGPHGAQS